MYNQLKTMIKVPQIVMYILKKKWKVADLEEWFHLAFWAWNGLMLGHPQVCTVRDWHSAKYKINLICCTSFVCSCHTCLSI